MVQVEIASGRVGNQSNIRVSSVRYGGRDYSPEQFKRLGIFGGFGGGGGGIERASEGSPFVDRFAQERAQARSLEIDRPKVEQASQQTSARLDAFNRIQNAINQGQPVPRDAVATLGVGSTDLIGSRWENLRGQLGVELAQSQAKISDYNARVGALSAQIARPTAIEQQVGASLLDRGASIQLLQRAQPAPVPASFERPEVTRARLQQALPQTSRATISAYTPPPEWQQKPGQFVKGFFPSFTEAILGKAGTEKPYFEVGAESRQVKTVLPVAEGSIIQRTGGAFLEPVKFGTEVGRGYGGEPGAFFGSLLGTGAGFGFGILEATYGTGARAIGLTTGKVTGSKTAGELSEAGARLLLGPKGAIKLGGTGLKLVETKTPQILGGIRAVERGKSIYGATPFADLLSGVGVTVARAGGAARTAIQAPVVKYPLLYGAPLLAPTAGEAIVRGSNKITQSEKYELATQIYYPAATEKFSAQGAPLPQFLFGGTNVGLGQTTGALGQSMGLNLFGGEALGAENKKESFELAKQSARQAGYTGSDIETVAKLLVTSRKARQAGGLLGFTAVEILGEVQGRKIIGDSLTSLLSGQLVGLGSRQALKQTVKVTARQAPKFALLGAQEGLLGQATSDLLTRQARAPQELPKVIVQDPFKYLFAGTAGAISAPLLGLPVLGAGVYQTLKAPVKSTAAGVVGKGFLGLGYVLDPLEESGDYLANFLGRPEPRFRLKTVAGTVTQQFEGKRVSAKAPVSILEPFGLPTTQKVSTIQRAKGFGSIFGFGQPASIYNPQPAPSNVPSGVNVPSSISDLFGDFLQPTEPLPEQQRDIVDELNENVPQNVPTFFNVPVGVPSSKIGVPPFFPFLPSAGEGFGGRGRERKTFLNEWLGATSLLGPNLSRQVRKTARERQTPLDIFLGIKHKKIKSKKRR